MQGCFRWWSSWVTRFRKRRKTLRRLKGNETGARNEKRWRSFPAWRETAVIQNHPEAICCILRLIAERDVFFKSQKQKLIQSKCNCVICFLEKKGMDSPWIQKHFTGANKKTHSNIIEGKMMFFNIHQSIVKLPIFGEIKQCKCKCMLCLRDFTYIYNSLIGGFHL